MAAAALAVMTGSKRQSWCSREQWQQFFPHGFAWPQPRQCKYMVVTQGVWQLCKSQVFPSAWCMKTSPAQLVVAQEVWCTFPVADTVKPEQQYSSIAAMHPCIQQQLRVFLTKKLITSSTRTFFLPAPLHHHRRSSPALPVQSSVAKYIGINMVSLVIYAGGMFGGRGRPSASIREQLPQMSRWVAALRGDCSHSSVMWPVATDIRTWAATTTSRDMFFKLLWTHLCSQPATAFAKRWYPLPRDDITAWYINMLLMLLLSSDPGCPSIHTAMWTRFLALI